MTRTLAALAFIALGLGAATAQDATPAQPAAPEIVIDPAAPVSANSKQADLLTGLYATKAVIEICAVPVEANILAGIGFDQKRLEVALGMDQATSDKAYTQVKADVEKTTPDCAEGSPDRISVDAVAAIYAAQSAAAPAAAAPAAPAAPVEPAPPAQ